MELQMSFVGANQLGFGHQQLIKPGETKVFVRGYSAILQKIGRGYLATIPNVPGLVARGINQKEATNNLRRQIELRQQKQIN